MTQVRNAQGRFTKASHNGPRPHVGVELGVASGQRWASFTDDFLPQLRGTRAIKTWREMSDNDDTVGEILFAIEMLIRQVEWPVEPGGESPQDEEAAVFLETCRDDMSHSWADFLATVLTMLPYGWMAAETVYKMRQGPNPGTFITLEGKRQKIAESRFDDGRLGWRKLAYQPQEALVEWVLDEHGGIEAMKWAAGGARGLLPVEKLLLFRTTTARGPNGRSVLRNAYPAWWRKKRLEDLAVIGADRDLNGLPIARIPADDILDNGNFFQEAKKVVTRIKKDEQWGVVFPLEYNDEGNPMYEFDVLRSDGASSISAVKELIVYFAQAIAGVVLADFIRLGRDTHGSKALAEPKQQLFQKALQGWVVGIAEVLNRHAVPRLFALNNFNLEKLPRFAPAKIEDVNLEDLGRFVQTTGTAGMDWGFLNPDDPITDQIRQLAGFDAAPRETSTSFGKKVEFDPMSRLWKVK